MTFAHPWLLALLPITLTAAWWLQCRGVGGADERLPNLQRLWADRHGLSDLPRLARHGSGLWLALGLMTVTLALARPQWGTMEEITHEQSREVLLALDLSNSMLAGDVAPTRLARAKLLIEGWLAELRGERVGLVVFAGTAFLQSPLSADYEVLREFLAEMDPSYLPQAGTNYEALLAVSTKAFGQPGDGARFLVILSDGEAHDNGWKALIPALRQRGIRVVGLGVGTPSGGLIPDGSGGILKDEHGAAVLSRLESATLQELAEATGGEYREASSWVDIAALVNSTVDTGHKGDYVERRDLRQQEQFQWFLAPALLFFLLSYWLEFPVLPIARQLRRAGSLTDARRDSSISAEVPADRLQAATCDLKLQARATVPVAMAALLSLVLWPNPRSTHAAEFSTPEQSGRPGAPSSAGPALPLDATARTAADETFQNRLAATVALLSRQQEPAAADYAQLAVETIGFASNEPQTNAAIKVSVIDDALSAVDRGESMEAAAADWARLRQELLRLRQEAQEETESNPPDSETGRNEPCGSNGGEQASTEEQSAAEGEKGESAAAEAAGAQQEESRDSAATEATSAEGPAPDDDATSAAATGDDRNQRGAGSSDPRDAAASGPPDTTDASATSRHEGQKAPEPEDESKAFTPASPHTYEQGGEVEPQALRQLDADAAGFGEIGFEAAPPEQAQPEQETRRVGGGRALSDIDTDASPALIEALARMERIKDGDSPAVLFDRMNRAEGGAAPNPAGKPW